MQSCSCVVYKELYSSAGLSLSRSQPGVSATTGIITLYEYTSRPPKRFRVARSANRRAESFTYGGSGGIASLTAVQRGPQDSYLLMELWKYSQKVYQCGLSTRQEAAVRIVDRRKREYAGVDCARRPLEVTICVGAAPGAGGVHQ